MSTSPVCAQPQRASRARSIRRIAVSMARSGRPGSTAIHGSTSSSRGSPARPGYFSGSDEEPVWVNEFSAEREMIYINTLSARLGSPQLDSIIAHEFCHMIEFNTRRRSAVWFNEGHAQLCEQGNNFSPGTAQTYLRLPDTQLNDWSDLEAAAAHYGLAYMFLEFLRQQAGGEDFIRALMLKGVDTPADIDAVLKERGKPGVEELYANFVAANAFITMTADKQYSYPQGAPARQPASVVLGDTVATGGIFRSTVHEYAVRYVELPRARFQLKFDGSTSNRLIPSDPHSGRAFWWSDKGDGMDSTLTKTLDLRSATSPQLGFWTWFDIEADYDYGYVEVSSDNGGHWTPLRTESSTTADPNGQNLGNGITGGSSGASATGWRRLTADLSPYPDSRSARPSRPTSLSAPKPVHDGRRERRGQAGPLWRDPGGRPRHALPSDQPHRTQGASAGDRHAGHRAGRLGAVGGRHPAHRHRDRTRKGVAGGLLPPERTARTPPGRGVPA